MENLKLSNAIENMKSTYQVVDKITIFEHG